MKRSKFLAGLLLTLIGSSGSLIADHYIEYDYIIVGNGTAGSVLARKLSDDKKTKVLVLEASIDTSTDPLVLAASGPNLNFVFTELTSNPKYAESYETKFTSFGAPLTFVTYNEGHGWGGGSAHNYQLTYRGSPYIYDQWAVLSNNPFWSYNSLLPLMKALENYTPCMTTPNSAQRGTGGPISITQTSPLSQTDPLAMALAGPLAGNAGFLADYNDPTSVTTTGHLFVGFSAVQHFATSPSGPCSGFGVRSYSSKEFLPPSIVSPNGVAQDGRLLRIESDTHVSRVLFKKKKAVGVEFVFGTKRNHAQKAYGKKIILCAGSINSPAILQRSGIGDPAILEPLGIDVIVANPNVGANLNNQYGLSTTVGLATAGVLGTWDCTGAGAALGPNFNYPDDNIRRVELIGNAQGPVSGVILFMLNPNSRGTVQIVSRDQFTPPNINLNMYSDGPYTQFGTDANLMVTTLQLLLQAVGGAAINPPASDAGNAAALNNFLTRQSGPPIAESHVCSTCRMGTSIANGVVDGTLHVFGVKNLMVADNSAVPVIEDGNTCYTAYMMGLGAAAILGVPTPPAL